MDGINFYRIPVTRSRKGITSYLNEYLSFLFRATIKLSSLYFRKRYCFIQVNTLPDFLVFATLIPKLFGAKVVLDLHEPAPELFSVLFGSKSELLISLIKFFEKISIRYADRAITVSEQMKTNYVNRGSSASKIDVVLNVPNLEFDPDLYKNGSKRNDHKFILICHGAILK